MAKKKKVEDQEILSPLEQEIEAATDVAAPVDNIPENLDEEGQALDHGDAFRIGNPVFVRLTKNLAVGGEIAAAENERGQFEVIVPAFRLRSRSLAVHRSRLLEKEPNAVAQFIGYSSRMAERLASKLHTGQ